MHMEKNLTSSSFFNNQCILFKNNLKKKEKRKKKRQKHKPPATSESGESSKWLWTTYFTPHQIKHKVKVETSNLVKSKVANTDLKDFFKANLKLEENGWNGESDAQQNFSKYK